MGVCVYNDVAVSWMSGLPSAMNLSTPSSRHEPLDLAGFTPGSMAQGVPKKADALPMITVIVVIFVLLAVVIIVLVRYGPQLRVLQVTLYHDPMPQELENGVRLMDWKKLDSKRKGHTLTAQGELGSKDTAVLSSQCSCKHQLPCGNLEPNVIEITYL
ncbi:small integral membrane protein 33 [Carettochelys insculpta]|uniref:small integral membrane protein 33 n=1 Tax=Carettochelys insculpta TaxID=44489 RepID=UPI003EB84111